MRVWADAADPVGVVTFTVVGHDPGLVAAYLSAEHGIGVRDGRFCAHPLLARLGYASGAVRASVGVGTTQEEVDRLVAARRGYVADGPRARYEHRRRLLDRRGRPASAAGRARDPRARGHGRRVRALHRLSGRAAAGRATAPDRPARTRS